MRAARYIITVMATALACFLPARVSAMRVGGGPQTSMQWVLQLIVAREHALWGDHGLKWQRRQHLLTRKKNALESVSVTALRGCVSAPKVLAEVRAIEACALTIAMVVAGMTYDLIPLKACLCVPLTPLLHLPINFVSGRCVSMRMAAATPDALPLSTSTSYFGDGDGATWDEVKLDYHVCNLLTV
jgi:hypothetical protein